MNARRECSRLDTSSIFAPHHQIGTKYKVDCIASSIHHLWVQNPLNILSKGFGIHMTHSYPRILRTVHQIGTSLLYNLHIG
jgi:hypothetical protein